MERSAALQRLSLLERGGVVDGFLPFARVVAAMGATPKPPTCRQLMIQLKKLGKESHRKTFSRHGAPPDQSFGVPGET